MSDFSGTGVALVTPLSATLEVDYAALERLIEHVSTGGVDYLVVLGTTGESPVFSWDEKLQILDFVLKKAGQTPVVMGMGGNHTLQLLHQMEDLNERRLAGILSASPYYNKPSQRGIQLHYEQLADQSKHPVLLYNVPHRTSSNITAETTLALAKHPKIVGIKEASGDLEQCSRISQGKPDDFLLISGDDLLTLPILSVGGEGVISVLANALPKPFTSMVLKARNGERAEAINFHLDMLPAMELASKEGNPTSIKAALKAINVCETFVKPPLVPASEGLVDDFRTLFTS